MLQLLPLFIWGRFTGRNPEFTISIFYTFFLIGITFLIYKTGKVSRYRSIFFSLHAVLFAISFMASMIDERGSFILKNDDIANLKTPMCHIAIFMTLIPAIFKQILIFPTQLVISSIHGFYPIFFLWIVGSLTLGRGWCSFACFFGGLDELCSKIAPKAVINTESWNKRWRLFPFAFMIVLILWSFVAMKPTYCIWFCPYKATTEFLEITNFSTYIQAVIFITLFMGLVVILPLLTKKRTQCGLFCPFGAFQSIIGLANPYRVRIDRDKCINCKRCSQVCPVFAIQDEHIKKGVVSITCTRCGLCMDKCSQGAIDYTFIGKPVIKRDRQFSNRIIGWIVQTIKEIFEPRTLFIFSGIFFGSVFLSSFVVDGIHRLIHLIATGSLLLR